MKLTQQETEHFLQACRDRLLDRIAQQIDEAIYGLVSDLPAETDLDELERRLSEALYARLADEANPTR